MEPMNSSLVLSNKLMMENVLFLSNTKIYRRTCDKFYNTEFEQNKWPFALCSTAAVNGALCRTAHQ